MSNQQNDIWNENLAEIKSVGKSEDCKICPRIISYTNKIICGDSKDVLANIDAESIDLVVTSPPYDDARDYKGYSWDFPIIARELARVLTSNGVLIWNVSSVTHDFCETLTPMKQAIFFVEETGLKLADTMIFHRTSGPPQYPGTKRYSQSWEYIFIFAKSKNYTFNPIRDVKNKTAGQKISGTTRQKNGTLRKIRDGQRIRDFGLRDNVWDYSVGLGNSYKSKDEVGNHPAVMHLSLARDLILSYSVVGNTVLDPFAGSGTTLLAAKELDRNFIGIDISPEYIKTAQERINSIPNKLL